MPNTQVKNVLKLSQTPEISSFEVIRDDKFVGFKVKINWQYDTTNSLIGFRIFRFKSPKVLLNKEYKLTQASLERLGSVRSFFVNNTALYNKSLFSQNSKVSFSFSGSSRFDKKDEIQVVDFLDFSDIGFIPFSRNGKYEFCDKNVIFGESYIYCISSISDSMIESPKSSPIVAKIEDVESPSAPDSVFCKSVSNTISITAVIDSKNNDISSFDVYKKDREDSDYKFLANFKSLGDSTTFIDKDVIPGKVYDYKVYSVDFFENRSLTYKKDSESLSSLFPHKKENDIPDVKISPSGGSIRIQVRKNGPSIKACKILRQDSWRKEISFSEKEIEGFVWPSIFFLADNSPLEFEDSSVVPGRFYRYRVVYLNNSFRESTSYTSPHVSVEDCNVNSKKDFSSPAEKQVQIRNFSVSIDQKKQIPIYCKISWNIDGSYDVVRILVFDSHKRELIDTFDVDNIHSFMFYNKFSRGNSYSLQLEVLDSSGVVVARTGDVASARINL